MIPQDRFNKTKQHIGGGDNKCLSLPTKDGFFEKIPTGERERLGVTHV